uniref:SCP domain-containing protein n=1 Tax=Phytophthora ramorum TaxID=164328 RepID=H3GQ78_PHYRM
MNLSCLKVLIACAFVGLANANASMRRELQVADFGAKLLEAVNKKRSERGLAAVCINEKLSKAAQVLADDMAQNNFVGTTGSDGSTLSDRVEEQNMSVSASAEVVAAGYNSVDKVVASWAKSSDSYIFSDLPFLGPGYKYDATKQYKHYWVLDLADGEGETCA